MQKHQLGKTGPEVSAVGLGCMGMSGMYGPADRAESVATLHAALDADIPQGDLTNYRLASEVSSLAFRYFDGTSWTESWDSTTLGEDGVTPIGSPRAIEIKIGIQPPRARDATQDPEIKYYRHVVAIPTANGTSQSTTGAGTTP